VCTVADVMLGQVRLESCYPMGRRTETDACYPMGRRIETDAYYPMGRRIETDAYYPMGRRIETDACYPMGRRIETDSLYLNPMYPNTFLEADLKILVFPTFFVLLNFETRTLQNV
jgi:hypothetical protein